MRSALLFLSSRQWLRRWIETSSVPRKLTERFVAGKTLDEALEVCRRLNRQGILVTLDHLGENVQSEREGRVSAHAYLEALGRIAEEKLEATVSVKLTHFGLGFSERLCRSNVETVVAFAANNGGFVEVDMESHEYVDLTLRIVRELHAKYGKVRAVVQAYLRRTAADLEMLCREGIPVRLCKGAYSEPAAVAFTRKSEVTHNYLVLAKFLLENGNYPGFATHDPNVVMQILGFVQQRRVLPKSFEFQMLYGIRKDLQRLLTNEGYQLRLYVPFGAEWYPYLMRRLAERPANILLVAHNLLHR